MSISCRLIRSCIIDLSRKMRDNIGRLRTTHFQVQEIDFYLQDNYSPPGMCRDAKKSARNNTSSTRQTET